MVPVAPSPRWCQAPLRWPTLLTLGMALWAGVPQGCGGNDAPAPVAGPRTSSSEGSEQDAYAEEHGLELKKYDLNRDQQPDIFKFYRLVDDPQNPGNQLEQMVRKEIDINHDGKIDVLKLYDDDQVLVEEHTDLDFDGVYDERAYFKGGIINRKEIDLDYDGRPDIWKYYDDQGQLARIESDRTGDGVVETWEYYEKGQLDRIGIDDNGDGEVDHWERKREAQGPVPADPGASPPPDEGDGAAPAQDAPTEGDTPQAPADATDAPASDPDPGA